MEVESENFAKMKGKSRKGKERLDLKHSEEEVIQEENVFGDKIFRNEVIKDEVLTGLFDRDCPDEEYVFRLYNDAPLSEKDNETEDDKTDFVKQNKYLLRRGEIFRSLTFLHCSNYAISTHGNLLNITTGRISKGHLIYTGYLQCSLISDNRIEFTMLTHILVALAFLDNPENKPTVDHIDRIRNHNNVTNLRWATCKEQAQNKRKYVKTVGRPIYQYTLDFVLIRRWNMIKDAAEALNTDFSKIRQCCSKKAKCLDYIWRYCDDIDYADIEWTEYKKEGFYSIWVCRIGLVRLKTGKVTKGNAGGKYLTVTLTPINKKTTKSKAVYVQCIMSETFIGPSNGLDTNHKNGDTRDNHIDNLEYCTRSENNTHAVRTGLRPKNGEDNYNAIPVELIEEVDGEYVVLEKYPTVDSAEKAEKIGRYRIMGICNGKRNPVEGLMFRFAKKQ